MVNYTILFIGFVIVYYLFNHTDDDDDMDGGMMVPAYQRPQQGSFLMLKTKLDFDLKKGGKNFSGNF